jgi:hypothetical protein
MPETPAAPMPETPAAPTTPEGGVEDLFKESPTTTPPATPPSTEPAAPAAPGEQPKAAPVEDLFKEASEPSATPASAETPATEPPAAEAPAAEPPAAEPAKGGTEDLFSDPPANKSTSLEAPGAMRLWTDNTGKFSVSAQLVSFTATHVRLLKDTGKYTTVPMTRLSQSDLEFVAYARANWTGSVASK